MVHFTWATCCATLPLAARFAQMTSQMIALQMTDDDVTVSGMRNENQPNKAIVFHISGHTESPKELA